MPKKTRKAVKKNFAGTKKCQWAAETCSGRRFSNRIRGATDFDPVSLTRHKPSSNRKNDFTHNHIISRGKILLIRRPEF